MAPSKHKMQKQKKKITGSTSKQSIVIGSQQIEHTAKSAHVQTWRLSETH